MKSKDWTVVGLVLATVMCVVLLQAVVATIIDGGDLSAVGNDLVLWLGLIGLTVAGWASR